MLSLGIDLWSAAAGEDLAAGGPPAWVLRPGGAIPLIDIDFANGLFYGTSAGAITATRSTAGWAPNSAGVYTQFAAGVPRITDLGLLVEDVRTNSIRNNSMQGAVVGTPGTSPTNWGVTPTTNAVVVSVAGLSTINGVNCISYRYVGVAAAATQFSIVPEAVTGIAATNGQTWTLTGFLGLTINSGSTPAVYSNIDELSAVPAVLANTAVLLSPSSTLTRISQARTNGNASTAYVRGDILINVSIGLTYDFTVTFGWPQMELGAFPSSPIVTTSAAVQRTADNISLALSPGSGNYTLFAAFTPQAPAGTSTAIIAVSDTTIANRALINRNAANTGGVVTVASVGQTSPTSAVLPAQNARSKAALSVTSGRAAISVNGSAAASSAPASIPSAANLSTLQFGNRGDGLTQLYGIIDRVTVFSTALSDANLQSIST